MTDDALFKVLKLLCDAVVAFVEQETSERRASGMTLPASPAYKLAMRAMDMVSDAQIGSAQRLSR
jgi:hypothetical protein